MVKKGFHEQRNAAGLEHVLGHIFAAGLEVGDVRRLLENFSDVKEIKLDAAFMGDGGQVKCCIGGATRRRPQRLRHFPGPSG